MNLQGIYVALFGRPADPEGLAHFTRLAETHPDLSWLDGLADSSEYSLHAAGLTTEEVVSAIYRNLFSRDPEAEGLAYYVAGLNSGRFTATSVALAILEGASGADLATLAAKIDAATLFTQRLDTVVEIVAYSGPTAAVVGRHYLEAVTAEAYASVEGADGAIFSLLHSGGQFEAGEVRDQPTLSMTTLAPMAAGDSRLITQMDLLASAHDPQNLPLMALDLQLVGKGALLSNGDGTWTFLAAQGDESEITLTYLVTNSWSLPVATTATLDILPLESPKLFTPMPQALPSVVPADLFQTDEGIAIVGLGGDLG